jgi:predicted aminopeptidase
VRVSLPARRHRVAHHGPERRGGQRLVRVVTCLLLLGLLAGCAPVYVLRAAYEEARILWRRRPIAQVLAGHVDAETREKLELTLQVRRFARDALGLEVGGSYATLSYVDADQIVYVVTAAPRDRIEPYTWWFPIVGRVPYRGYFDQADAAALAAQLEREGYDTMVQPSVAFSTLGWFDDPLLSTLLRYPPVALAEIIIHELLHNTIYLPGHAAFNESFATFVGNRGARAFFASRGDGGDVERADRAWADALQFSRFLAAVIERLDRAYAAGVTEAERRHLFDVVQADFREQSWNTQGYASFGSGVLNNAVLVHYRLYAEKLALFERAKALNAGNLAAAIEWIRSRVRGAPDPFRALEDAVEGSRLDEKRRG